MTTTDIPDTGQYTIKETAALIGVCRNTLRGYTDKGFIRCSFRRGTGKKFYYGKEIKRYLTSTL